MVLRIVKLSMCVNNLLLDNIHILSAFIRVVSPELIFHFIFNSFLFSNKRSPPLFSLFCPGLRFLFIFYFSLTGSLCYIIISSLIFSRAFTISIIVSVY